MNTDSDCSEALTVTFEWTLRGLKNLFDSTKGDKKSKVTKSMRFGNGKWQVCSIMFQLYHGMLFLSKPRSFSMRMQVNRRRVLRVVSLVCSFLARCIPFDIDIWVNLTVNDFRQPTIEEKEAALAGRQVVRCYSVLSLHRSLCSTDGYGRACSNSPSSFESEDSQIQVC